MNHLKTLDYLAVATSHKIAEVINEPAKNGKVQARDLETLVTKALGILQSQGIYAMALFLFSRSGQASEEAKMKAEERVATQILSCLWHLRNPYEALKKLQTKGKQLCSDKESYQINSDKDDMLKEWANLSSDLDTLFLVRDLYEQTLIYARYHAKAMGGNE